MRIRFGSARAKGDAGAGLAGKPISARAGGRGKAWTPVLVFAVFFLAGLGFLIPLFVIPAVRVQAAKGWRETPCTVVSSQVKSHAGDDGTTYSVDIVYRYVADGKERQSNRYGFMGGSSSGREGKQAVVSGYPPGRETVCYVNPENPLDAVLNRGWTAEFLLGLIPLVFVLVGVGGMIGTGTRALFGAGQGEKNRLTAAGPWRGTARAAAETAELRPRQSPPAKLIVITLAAVFWNGIVSIFLWQVTGGWRRGHGEWFPTLFLIPFVLVGLGLIGGIFYQILALFNPRPRLTLTPGAVRLGDSVRLTWRFSGDAGRMNMMEIILEGREEATYRRGTDTRTDKNVFMRLPVFTTRKPGEMAAGRAEFTVPADTMHSFDAANNKIVWAIGVHGEIKRWPDVKEEFEVRVMPAETGTVPGAGTGGAGAGGT